MPGLIDIHLHARDAALPPSTILATGVTTIVDAGSRGADNVDQLIAIAQRAPNRMRILLNVGRLGNNPNGRGEFLDGIEPADVDKARAAVEKNRAWIVGIKARLSRSIAADHDLEVLRRAQQVAAPLNIPVMIHIGDTASPLPQILALLRPGDIVTHLYAPTQGILDSQGRVLPEVRAARVGASSSTSATGVLHTGPGTLAKPPSRKVSRPTPSQAISIWPAIRNKSSTCRRSSRSSC